MIRHLDRLTLAQGLLLSAIEAAGGRCSVLPYGDSVRIAVSDVPNELNEQMAASGFYPAPSAGCWAWPPAADGDFFYDTEGRQQFFFDRRSGGWMLIDPPKSV